jgi:hypothetical protein
VLKALVQSLKDVEDEDLVFNGRAEVGQTVGHGFELVVVLSHREVALNKIVKGSVKMKSVLLMVTVKLILNGKPQMVCRATAFPDHLVEFQQDGVANPIEDDTVHPYPPQIIGQSIVRDMFDEGVALKACSMRSR